MKYVFLGFLFMWSTASQCQHLDLIVTTRNDSIACTIDSIENGILYFTTTRNKVQVTSEIPLTSISSRAEDAVSEDSISRIPNTIYFRTTPPQAFSTSHAVYGTLGYLIIYGNLQLNYEYTIINRTDRFFKQWAIQVGFGYYLEWYFDGPIFSNTMTGLTGSGNHHLELGLGYGFLFNYSDEYLILPAGKIGYRFQKPDGGALFRIGISSPETLYIGIGVSF